MRWLADLPKRALGLFGWLNGSRSPDWAAVWLWRSDLDQLHRSMGT